MNALERDRLLAVLLLSGLVVLLVFAAMNLGGSLPDLPKANPQPPGARASIPVSSIDALFAPNIAAQLAPAAKTLNPFYTTYYQPPPPKPPTTRKVALTYQGFIESAGGQKQAFLKVDERLFVGPLGAKVVADLVVKNIAMRTLTLTNSAAKSSVLEFNVRNELEVPVE